MKNGGMVLRTNHKSSGPFRSLGSSMSSGSSSTIKRYLDQNNTYKYRGQDRYPIYDFGKYYDPLLNENNYVAIGKDNNGDNAYSGIDTIYQGTQIYPPLLESKLWPPEVIDEFKSSDGKFYLTIIDVSQLPPGYLRGGNSSGPSAIVTFIKVKMDANNQPLKDTKCMFSKCYITEKIIFVKNLGEYAQEQHYFNTHTQNPKSPDFYTPPSDVSEDQTINGTERSPSVDISEDQLLPVAINNDMLLPTHSNVVSGVPSLPSVSVDNNIPKSLGGKHKTHRKYIATKTKRRRKHSTKKKRSGTNSFGYSLRSSLAHRRLRLRLAPSRSRRRR